MRLQEAVMKGESERGFHLNIAMIASVANDGTAPKNKSTEEVMIVSPLSLKLRSSFGEPATLPGESEGTDTKRI